MKYLVPVLFLILIYLPQPLNASQSKPNILVLMVEDMSARVNALGDGVAVTPNLDKLASESVYYPNTFTTAGVCSPSRAAFMMGVMQTEFGAQHMRTGNFPEQEYKTVPPANMKAFPELLRAAGYQTYIKGKLDYQFSGLWAGSGPSSMWDLEGSDSHWRDLEQDKPFFGLVNFMLPHETGMFAPLGHWPNSRMHLFVQLYRAWLFGIPPEHYPVKPADIKLEPYYPDIPSVREEIARHYNNIALMDEQVGQVMTELKQDELLDNTIVIWVTDHGDGLPRAKRELLDSGIKVPMLIRWPEHLAPQGVEAGNLDKRLISFVDLAPTILSLANTTKSPHMTGHDFSQSKQQRQYVYAARDRMGNTPDRQRAIRDQQFKYIYSYFPELPAAHPLKFRENLQMVQDMRTLFENGDLSPIQAQWFQPVGKERFYDLKNDPHELNNLIDHPEYQIDVNRFRAELKRWQTTRPDMSEQSESEMVNSFLNQRKPYQTAEVDYVIQNKQIQLSSATNGASIEYKLDDQPWQLYTNPIEVDAGTKVNTRAVRYGYEPSEEMSFTAP